jgi:GTP-binding protein HflX
MLADTVGFINKIPHSLIEAFKSTLEEVRCADLLLHVVDVSHPRYEDQIEVVEAVLRDIGAGDAPSIMAPNKIDLAPATGFGRFSANGARAACPISALTGKGIDRLLEAIEKTLDQGKERSAFSFSPAQGSLLAVLRSQGRILDETYEENEIHVTALLSPKLAGQMKKWLAQSRSLDG